MNNSQQLISELTKITNQCISSAIIMKQKSLEELNYKKEDKSWSILECLEHLNYYGDFYIPEIKKQIVNTKYKSSSSTFKSSFLGKYFVNMMKLKDGQIRKMKTFHSMNPNNSNLSVDVIERFLQQQLIYLDILNEANKIDLTKTKTSISISKLIKLRLCDTLMVVVYHNERHIWQASKLL